MTRRGRTVAQSGPENVPARKSEWPKTIRTTMEPDREYEVGEAEYTDLSRRRLIKGK